MPSDPLRFPALPRSSEQDIMATATRISPKIGVLRYMVCVRFGLPNLVKAHENCDALSCALETTPSCLARGNSGT